MAEPRDRQELDALVLGALKKVIEPTGKNIVDAGIVSSVEGEGESALAVTCEAPGWPEPIRQRIGREVVARLREAFPELDSIKVKWQEPAPAKPVAAAPPDIKHIVAVGSGKGGVGKSTLAASLAYALKERGLAVGLMDADVYGPSIPHMLGILEQPTVDSEPTLRIGPPAMDGIPVMSMGFLVPPEKAVIWRGPMLHKAVKDFLHAVAWGSLDVLIVDLPPGTGDIVLSLSQEMPVSGGVIVCTPQDVALLDARKALDMFRTVRIPCLGLVENMSGFACPSCGARHEIFGCGGAKSFAERSSIPFLGAVPINLQVRLNGDAGHVRDNFAKDSAVRNDLLAIADALLAQLAAHGAPASPEIEIV
jgi:ATP-binding protein involved in chromosome partitioning